MALNDNAVITAAVGYVFVAEPGTAKPTASQLKTLDVETFGAQVHNVTVASGGSGTVIITIGGTPAAAVPHNATPDQVQAAVEAVAGVGVGNTKVTGTALNDASGIDIALVGTLQGQALTLSAATGTGTNTPTATVKTALNGWKGLGHTSRGDMPEFGFEGGTTEVRGSWQNESLREVVTEALADFLTLFLHQFDEGSFELYFGENASAEAGVFGVANGTPAPVEKAFLVIIVDGDVRVGFYAAKASVRRDDSIALPVDDFAALPIRATFLKLGTRLKFEWINEDLFPNA